MSEKQDRTYARTAQDIERKYSFGKTFADMLGLINENRDKVDSVQSSMIDGFAQTATELKRTADEISLKASKEIEDLSSKVELKLDADSANIVVDKVTTRTGYEFGSDGLDISKSGEEMRNKLDYKGMYVTKNGNEILTADKDGVKATDLHATTYLIIGKGAGRSRLEDYGTDRTALFWIGG